MYIENKTQQEKILLLLNKYRGEWVPLPKIIRLGIAQYNARIYGLRKKGYKIKNKTETKRIFFGLRKQKCSFFKLIMD